MEKKGDLIYWIFCAIFLIVLCLTYIFFSKNMNNLTPIHLILFLFLPFILFFGIVCYFLNKLWETRNIEQLKLYKIIISYLFSVFFIVVFFAYIFATLAGFTNHGIKDGNKNLEGIFNYLYFSGLNFYSSAFGEATPLGLSRLFVLIELALSSIIHVMVISIIISKYIEK